MTPVRKAAAAAALALLAGGPASAQGAAQPTPPTDLDGKPGTLSDKLGRTNGVIKPEGNIDPDIRKPAPQTGTMPVIKPGTVAPGTAK